MPRQNAFTLIEVLLAIALLALVASVMISGTTNLLHLQEDRPDQDFWDAITAARQQALEREQIVYLHYDDESHQLICSWPEGKKAHPLPAQSVKLLPAEKTGTKLLGGILFETDELPGVRFYPDGTCDAFRVELVEADGRKDELSIDPWTCAPVLTSKP